LKTTRGVKSELAKQQRRKNFDEILLDAIDEALFSLGENVKITVYFQLENLFKIKRHEIPNNLSDFSDALEKLFGLGARQIEIMFIKNLHNKIKITCKWPTYEWPLSKWIVPEMTFQEYVQLMRQKFKAANTKHIDRGLFENE